MHEHLDRLWRKNIPRGRVYHSYGWVWWSLIVRPLQIDPCLALARLPRLRLSRVGAWLGLAIPYLTPQSIILWCPFKPASVAVPRCRHLADSPISDWTLKPPVGPTPQQASFPICLCSLWILSGWRLLVIFDILNGTDVFSIFWPRRCLISRPPSRSMRSLRVLHFCVCCSRLSVCSVFRRSDTPLRREWIHIAAICGLNGNCGIASDGWQTDFA